MRPVQPSVAAIRHHVMLSAVPSSSIVNSVIRITGIGDHDRLEWLIRISGMRTYERGCVGVAACLLRIEDDTSNTGRPSGSVSAAEDPRINSDAR
jgi:hypothetical protein